MLELLLRRWWLIVLRGVVAILFGLLALAWPGITVLALALLWGIYALVDGVTAAVVGLSGRSLSGFDRVAYVLLGLLGVGAGLVSLIWPHITVLVLLLAIAVWAIVAGIIQISAAIRLRKVIKHEWFLAISGVLALVLGVLLVAQPAKGALALLIVIATFAIVWGVTLVLLGFRVRIAAKDLASAQT